MTWTPNFPNLNLIDLLWNGVDKQVDHEGFTLQLTGLNVSQLFWQHKRDLHTVKQVVLMLWLNFVA